ncbi:hypothetical protein ACFYXJ_04950 [Streptomyces sp. NPDC002667]|uniref:hypothetical protein n=1 Tax=Streptomyces sp. NPDC002667 TaxID=3364657 RepID=UPI00367461B9
MSRLRAPECPNYPRVVRASAWYDLAVTAGFATPWTYALVHDALSSAGTALGVGGLPELDVWQVLFANLMGSVVVVWAALRIVRPRPEYGLFDGMARALFATWQLYALAHGVSQLVWLFFAVEVAFGALQLAPWRWTRNADLAGDETSRPLVPAAEAAGPPTGPPS